MDRVFLDANILYAAAYHRASTLRRLWELPDVELWTSTYAAGEALGNLAEDHPEKVRELERLISRLKLQVKPASEDLLPEGITIVAKDLPVFCAAIASGATHFLTGDRRHFGRYFGLRITGVLVLTPTEYLGMRKKM